MPKISVALCTFNGERFIERQLRSILSQTQAIDELIVCDDRSTDRTLELLTAITANAPFTTSITINEQRLGSTKNFEKALQHCTGDIVFLCDQDDEWQTEKVSRQVQFLEQNPDVDAVFTNALIINDNSQSTGETLWEQIQFEEQRQKKWLSGKSYELLFESYVVTGATLALRKSALPALLPFPTIHKQLIHDGWIALVLALDNKIQFIDDCLLRYRIHHQQQVGIGARQQPITLKERLQRDRSEKLVPLQIKADYLTKLYDLLMRRPNLNTSKLSKLKAMKDHFEVRASLPANRIKRISPVWQELTQQRYRYSSEHWWLPLLGDIFE
jgi:glycosyltransferase involved in cell wall biosynthesis